MKSSAPRFVVAPSRECASAIPGMPSPWITNGCFANLRPTVQSPQAGEFARIIKTVPLLPYRSYVLISREQIARNYRNVRAAVGRGVGVMGVVKADAYGHGAVEVSRILTAEGAEWLAVSSVPEGVALRRAGIQARILVMTGFLPYESQNLVAFNLTPAVHSLSEVAELNRMARESGRTVDYHLKVDSGMNRLGTRASAAEIIGTLRSTTHAHLDGLMTHFASPADFTSSQTEEQSAYFARIVDELR